MVAPLHAATLLREWLIFEYENEPPQDGVACQYRRNSRVVVRQKGVTDHRERPSARSRTKLVTATPENSPTLFPHLRASVVK